MNPFNKCCWIAKYPNGRETYYSHYPTLIEKHSKATIQIAWWK